MKDLSGRSTRADGENRLTVASVSTHIEQLERLLLRRGLGALEANRDRCVDCGRTPLAGERVHHYAARQHGIICELCRSGREDAPLTSELVRHCEHGHAVRLMARAA
jgi:hypothetical protein